MAPPPSAGGEGAERLTSAEPAPGGSLDAAVAAESAADPIVVVDADHTITYANPAADALTADDELVGRSLESIFRASSGQRLDLILNTTPQRLLIDLDPVDDTEEVAAEVSVNPTEAPDGRRWILVVHRLPRQDLSIRELLRRATHDDLTGLANRSHLIERLEATFRDPVTAQVPHALLMVDLDGFKHINDRWGHDTGDAVLVEIAARLKDLCRPGDVVARLGGDEFAAWCHGIDDAEVPALAARLATVFVDPVTVGDLDLAVEGSLGATTTTHAHAANELLRQADAAMYRAKGSGPGHQVVFDAAMDAEMRERGVRERELRVALATDQLVLHFQPVIDLRSRTAVGVEALVRWDHPRLGQLHPADFLPLVETTLLSDDFAWAVIERACAQLAEWTRTMDEPLSVWVNVSPRNLTEAFVVRLAALVTELDVDPHQLVIEITEDAAVTTPEGVAALEAVHGLGVRIAVDDFGTGYSQLTYLADLPIDLVKLDKSFVQGISREPDRHSLAKSVIGLAHALHAEVVAEGVESIDDLLVLDELGCDHAQGFVLARPRAPGEIDTLDLRSVIDLR